MSFGGRAGSAREQILARVRAAKAGAEPPSRTIPRDYRRTDARPRAQLVSLFCERVGDYRAEVERVGIDDMRAAISRAAAGHQAHRLVVPPELPGDWRAPELDLIEDTGLTPAELDRLDGVVTGCTVAIAETGTIALSAAAHEGRRLLSLVPDLHICVVREDQIVGTVAEAITQLGEITRDARRPLTLISGPSATSDIELQRVEGVHGPRRLIVLVTHAGAAGNESDQLVHTDARLGVDQA